WRLSSMHRRLINQSLVVAAAIVAVGLFLAGSMASRSLTGQARSTTTPDDSIKTAAVAMIDAGRNTFRFDTFGDEALWGEALILVRSIVDEKRGGARPGVSPKKALEVCHKLDAEALPADLVAKIKAGQVDLDDPATTVALLKLKAVVGVTAFLDGKGQV